MKETRYVLINAKSHIVMQLSTETEFGIQDIYGKMSSDPEWIIGKVEYERPPRKIVRWGWKMLAEQTRMSTALYTSKETALAAGCHLEHESTLCRVEWEE